MAKKWYESKTVWANALMFAGVVVLNVTGTDFINQEVQAAILVVANLVLRVVTKDEIKW